MLARATQNLLLVAGIVVLGAPVASAGGKAECVEIPDVNRCPTWTARHDLPDAEGNARDDEAVATAMDPSGARLYVAGNASVDSMGVDILALAPTTGLTLWSTRVPGANAGLWYRHTLTVDPNGSTLYLLGRSDDANILVAALDPATGDVRWATEYDGPSGGSDWGRDLALSPDGRELYVTGSSEARAGDLVLLAFSASDGALRWTVRYRGPESNSYDIGHSVDVSPDGGRVFVTGRSSGNSSIDLMTLAYDVPGDDEDPSPTWAWVRRFIPYTNAGLSARVGLDVSADGSRVVMSGEGFNNFWTIAYDAATGQKLWSDELRGTQLSDGWASTLDESIVRIDGGRVFVAVSKAWDPGPLLASYDLATGETLWTTRYLAGPPLESASMVLAPDGDTIYTLASTMDAGYGASAAAFDASTGDQVWVGRMNSATEHIFGNDLAISPSGNALFATGSIRPLDYEVYLDAGTEDFLTWSYDL